MGTTPSISRKRDETSRTESDAPLEPAPLDFAYRASRETNSLSRLSDLVMGIPPLENLPSFRFLQRRWRGIGIMGVAARTAAETIVKTAVTTSGGEGTALARTPGTTASAAPVTNPLRDPGGEDEADDSQCLRWSRSRREERSTRETSLGVSCAHPVPGTQPFYTASSPVVVPDLRSS